jgi:hypothetical protein
MRVSIVECPHMSILAAILLSGTTVELDPAWKVVADPLAPVREGKIQCTTPDPARKTCSGFTWASILPDGRLRERTVHTLGNSPVYATESVTVSTLENGQFCARITMDDINNARIVRASAPHAAVNDRNLYIIFKQGMVDALLGKKYCAQVYRNSDTGDWMSVGTLDGEFAGELMILFSWISPGDGYRLKPPA